MGLLRAFVDMSVGILIGHVLKKYNSVIAKYNKGALTLVEIFGYILVFYIAFSQKNRSNIDALLIIFLSISVLISFSNYSYTAKLTKNIYSYLGIFSLNIFLNHFYVSSLLIDFGKNIRNSHKLVIYLVCVLLLSYFNYRISKIIKRRLNCKGTKSIS